MPRSWLQVMLRSGLLLAGLACPLPLAAANPKTANSKPDVPPQAELPRKEDSFGETARVVWVEVPVNVTDKEGVPIRGLSAADFELYEEGRAQTLTDFEVIDLEVLASTPSTDHSQLSPSARRHFLLLFDISFSNPASVLKARVAARSFVISKLHPSDLVAVATYSLETGPRLVVTFTPDRAQVAQAIDSLGLFRSTEVDPLRFLLEPSRLPTQEASAPTSDSANGLISSGADALREQIQIMSELLDRNERTFKTTQIKSFTRSLGEMARVLATIEGRKQVVLFSEGFDSRLLTGRPLTDIADSGDNRQLNIQRGEIFRVEGDDLYGNTQVQGRLDEMVQEFRRADCVIQAVDIGGLRASGSVREDSPINVGQESLFYMANETGGELFKDANNLEEQLGKVVLRSGVTYVLSFNPSNLKSDGTFRRLKVKLKGAAAGTARLTHRLGYYAPRPFEELNPLERQLLASEAIAAGAPAAEFNIHVLAAPFRATREWAYVPVIIEVDGKSLLASTHGDEHIVEFYAYVTDRLGQIKGFFTQEVKLDIARGRELLSAKGIKYYGHLELAAGEYLVRVLVRHGQSGRTAVRALPLIVPTFEQQQAVVLPPFFPEEPGSWLLVRERPNNTSNESTVYPFTVNGEPYVPAARPEIKSADGAEFCLVAYNLGEGELALEGQLTDADGNPVAGTTLELVERTSTGIAGLDKLRGRIRASSLTSGDYTLKVAITDQAMGRWVSNSISVTFAQ